MRAITRFAAVLACAAAVVTLGVATGCGGQGKPAAGSSGQWERVLSTQVSGAQPVKLNLGSHRLGESVRLAWTLSGPEKPPVVITFRIINVDNGVGIGRSVSPRTGPGLSRQDDDAITLGPIWPGAYIVYFTQRFSPARGPGYDIDLTIATKR